MYRVSLLAPIVERIEELSGVAYSDAPTAIRIITDHLRGAVFLGLDGVRPSNKEQGYVMRRLLRRAIRTAHGIGLHDSFVEPLVDQITDLYSDAYPEMTIQRPNILAALLREEQSFRRTLKAGMNAVEKFRGQTLTGTDIFVLSDTYGFPKELTIEEAQHHGITVSPAWKQDFDRSLQDQRDRSRKSSKLRPT